MYRFFPKIRISLLTKAFFNEPIILFAAVKVTPKSVSRFVFSRYLNQNFLNLSCGNQIFDLNVQSAYVYICTLTGGEKIYNLRIHGQNGVLKYNLRRIKVKNPILFKKKNFNFIVKLLHEKKNRSH